MKFGRNETEYNLTDEEKKLRNAFVVAAVAVVVVGIVFVTMMVAAIKQTSEVVKYDLNCVTELNENPLVECKEGSEK